MLLTKIFFSQKEVKDDRLACLKNNQYGGGWYTFQFPKLVHFYFPIDNYPEDTYSNYKI